MKNTILILSTLSLTACGAGTSVNEFVQVPTPTPTVDVTPLPAPQTSVSDQDIAAIVADENAYREGLGQTYLTNGLSCTLYTITGGQYIQNIAPTLTGFNQVASFLNTTGFNQPNSPSSDGLNVLPAALRSNPLYKNLIYLVCQGQLVVRTTDYYNFDLASDDGSLLYMDGGLLINNDGGHAVTEKSNSRYLRRGVHSIRLDFAQTGAGNQALILKQNGEILPGAFLYH